MGGLKHFLFRAAAVLAAGLALSLTTTAFANAAGPQPVPASELSKATSAAGSPTALGLLSKASVVGKSAAKVAVAQEARPVYALNPAFVRDASAPVATFWYAATTATRGTDRLTVYTAPDAKGTWQAVNVATGDTEARMFTAARGALVFTEPQIGAWYALAGDRVRPLNQSATQSIGTAPITVAAYQDLVATRYADKLPGSTYSDNGTAGGYDTTTAVATAASTHNYLIPGAAAGLTLLLATAFLIRRRTA
ncbi:hypothetical protein GCM10029976_096230 [Kribbella albertanoniae]|uniref:Uncharacterized protein n=1 Tax=Kribbella albertanoniae TaxID=1266829 RepID=A0A4R4QG58_9ACTN|nr:hypothetical protein [Kribbella albertanoniae]TDC34193.1 hypothetical protein E1261_04550 [Kribbella albertanoniae]